MRTIANNTDGSIIIDAKIDRSQIPAEFAELQKQITQELEKLEKTVDGLSANFDELNKSTKAVGDGLDDVKKGVESVGEGFKQSEEKASGFRKKTTDAVTQVAQTMQAMQIQELVRAIADAFAECAAASIEFESAMTGVFKTINGTDEQLRTIEQGIRDMSTELPSSASEIAAVAEAAGQLGVTTEGILDFTETMINLGEATNLTADEAASSLAKFANVTGMLEADYSRLGSVVVALGNTMATTEADIVAMGTRIASAGEQVGLTEDQIMGMAAALSSVGLEAEAGGTAISKLMIDMKSSASMADETAEMLSKTGMSVRELEMLADTSSTEFKALANELGYTSTELKNLVKQRGQLEKFAEIAGMTADQFVDAFGKDAAKTMATFFEGLGNGSEDAITILNDLGIEEVRLRDTMLRLTSASDLFAQAQSTAASAWEENIALAEEAEKRYETTESKIAMLGNAFNDLKISVGDVFSDTINNAVEWLTDITLAASEFVQEHPGFVKALGLFAGAIAGIGVAAAGAMAITSLISALSGMGSLIGIVSGVGAAIGILVTAVAGIAFDNEVESVRELTTALRDAKDGFAEADDVFTSTMDNVDATSRVAAKYVDRLEELERAGVNSAEAQDEYARTVAKLQTLMPELNIQLNETTGTIEGGTAAIREQIVAWKEAAEAQAYYAAYQQKLDLLVGAEMEVEINKDKLTKAEAELDKLRNTEVEDKTWSVGQNPMSNEQQAQTKLINEQLAKIENLKAALAESESLLPDLQADVDTVAKFLDIATQVQEVAPAVDASLQGIAQAIHNGGMTLEEGAALYGFAVSDIETELVKLEEAQKKADQAANFDNAIAAIENLATEYEENLKNAVESVDKRFSLLSDLPKKLKTSFDEITKNLQDQQKYWDDYSAGLQKLEDAGLSEKVMQKLSDGTEESVGIVAALVTEIENLGGVDSAKVQSKIDEINASFDDLEKSKGSVANTMAEIQTQFDTTLAAILESSGVTGTGSGEALVTAMKDALITNGGQINEGAVTSIVTALNQTIVDTEDDSQAVGKAITDGIRVGLESAQGDLTKASAIIVESIIVALKAALDSHSPSKRARDEVGITIPQGVAVGISDGTNDVIKAGNKLANDSMESLAEAFNKAFADVRKTISSNFSLLSEIPERAEEETKASFESILSNLKDQTKYWEDYEKGLKTLESSGLEKGIMQQLSDGSEKSINMVADLVAEVEKLGGTTSDTAKKMISDINYAYLQNESAIDSVSSYIANTRTGVTEEIAQLQKDLNILGKSSGDMIADAMKETIEANAPKVDEAAVRIFKTSLKQAEEEIKNEEMFEKLAEVFGSDAEELTKAIEEIYDSFSEFGKELVWAFINAFTDQLPSFQEAVITFFAALQLTMSQKLVENTYKVVDDMEEAMDVFFPYLFTSVNYILEQVPGLLEQLVTGTGKIVEAAVEMMTVAVQPLYENDDMLREAGSHLAEQIIAGFKENGELMAEFIQWVIEIWIGELEKEETQSLFTEAIGMMLRQSEAAVTLNADILQSAGQKITEGISSGVVAGLEEDDGVSNAFADVMDSIVEYANTAMEEQIESFNAIGSALPDAFASGIASSTANIDAMSLISGMLSELTSAASSGGAEAGSAWASAFVAAASAGISEMQSTVAGGAAADGSSVTNNTNTTYNLNYNITSPQIGATEMNNISNGISQRLAMGLL